MYNTLAVITIILQLAYWVIHIGESSTLRLVHIDEISEAIPSFMKSE